MSAAQLMGVLDLKSGQAVHAIAGRRHRYQPLAWCNGDPLLLLDRYRGLGVQRFYLADLDALTGGPVQHESIAQLCEAAASAELLIDVGWTGQSCPQSRQVRRLATRYDNTCWIAATESSGQLLALAELAAIVSPQRTYLGLDFRGGQFQCHREDQASWLQAAAAIGCGGAVVLDLQAVGTGKGPLTAGVCQQIHTQYPQLRLISGGGIRNEEDCAQLIHSGCDACLVATALIEGRWGQVSNEQ